jgi:hypothetical protein
MAQISGLTSAGQITIADLLMINQGNNGGVEKKVDIDTLNSYFKCKQTLTFTLDSTNKLLVFDASGDSHEWPSSTVFCTYEITVSGSGSSFIIDSYDFIKTSSSDSHVEFKDKYNYSEDDKLLYGKFYYRPDSSGPYIWVKPAIQFNQNLLNWTIKVTAYSMSDFTISNGTISGSYGAGYLFTETGTPRFVVDASRWGGAYKNAKVDINQSSLPASTDSDTLYFIP